ncbi:hypothetical protein [Micromonospora costi]|uniref:hypothetical protein n=1 Tax=Micromonospora costi TaxID=1530042 RepID=UPI0011C3E259|nr:hypothetical protein [Micromonospora costi]
MRTAVVAGPATHDRHTFQEVAASERPGHRNIQEAESIKRQPAAPGRANTSLDQHQIAEVAACSAPGHRHTGETESTKGGVRARRDR